ncbi:4Fe-4S binding protein [Olsenella massiliensis]|uniref:4Fe-4S binding protein n=1 Tax=Olsenella massiliensis TaxID=1622075 RepID=UPI00071D40EC|nr:4Fe-4S binding protein [Olsenella massiliensis]
MAKRRPTVAHVRCWGGSRPEERCAEGCIGCGACVEACRLRAIELGERGVARVLRDVCVGCGLCVRACPQGVIALAPRDATILPLCSNHEPGAVARASCASSCVACGVCERVCPADAIHVVSECATCDTTACIACGLCATRCPRGVIHDADGLLAPAY